MHARQFGAKDKRITWNRFTLIDLKWYSIQKKTSNRETTSCDATFRFNAISVEWKNKIATKIWWTTKEKFSPIFTSMYINVVERSHSCVSRSLLVDWNQWSQIAWNDSFFPYSSPHASEWIVTHCTYRQIHRQWNITLKNISMNKWMFIELKRIWIISVTQ